MSASPAAGPRTETLEADVSVAASEENFDVGVDNVGPSKAAAAPVVALARRRTRSGGSTASEVPAPASALAETQGNVRAAEAGATTGGGVAAGGRTTRGRTTGAESQSDKRKVSSSCANLSVGVLTSFRLLSLRLASSKKGRG